MLHLFYEKENDWVNKCMEYEVEGATPIFLALPLRSPKKSYILGSSLFALQFQCTVTLQIAIKHL